MVFIWFHRFYFGFVRCLGAGEMEVVDAFKMVTGILPNFDCPRLLEADDRYTAAAVFCRADYVLADAHASLNHWVPAHMKDEVDFALCQLEFAQRQTEKSLKQELAALEARRPYCENDEALLQSLEVELESVKTQYKNFAIMQKHLYENVGMICQHVKGDGNCGVYMMLSLIKDIQPSSLTPDDVRAFRLEIGRLWDAHSQDPMWQSVWQTLRNRLGASQPITPNKEKKIPADLPFTPDKVQGSKRFLPPGSCV